MQIIFFLFFCKSDIFTCSIPYTPSGHAASAQPSEAEYQDAVAAFLIQRGRSSFLDLESGWPRARVQWSDALDTDYG